MTRRKKILLSVGSSLAAALVILIVASLVVLQSAWFANFVGQKIIAVAEDSTGGVVGIGSFEFDWRHLTVRIRNFVLHGTEPKTADPLLRASLLELHLKLLAGLKKAVDLEYLGIERPQVNLLVRPDGSTNIPSPKVPKPPSQSSTSGLETVVNLAVHQFQIKEGLLVFSQRKNQQETSFEARGENLRVLLDYNVVTPSYKGSLAIDPLLLTSGRRPPLRVHVNLPLTIDKDTVTLTGGTLSTDRSKILIDASLHDLNAPVVSAHLNASVSLPEMQRNIGLPIDPAAKGVPQTLDADLAGRFEQKTNIIQVQTAHLGLGQTTFQASGSLDPARNSAVQFNGNLALEQLSRLFKVTSPQTSGAIQLNGRATLDARNNYSVDGTINSRALAVRSGDTRLSDLSIYSPFHADPYLISLDGLRLNVLGGGLSAKIFVEKMRNLSVEGALRNFSVAGLAQTLTGKQLGYGGAITGAINMKGDLKAPGTTGYRAQARLNISPEQRGVPLSGRITADYSGARAVVDLGQSFLTLPHSRLDLSGSLNRQIDVNLSSTNLDDFLPAANFGAAHPQTSLPVTLQNGSALLSAQIKGNLSAPQISSHVELQRFAVEQRPFDRFALDLAASPSSAAVQNGVLTRKSLQTNFDGSLALSKWQPLPRSALNANVALRNADLADLLSLAEEGGIPVSGQATADVHINGTFGNPLGTAGFQINDGSAYDQPFEHVLASVRLDDRLITLANFEVAAAGARLNLTGTFSHARDTLSAGHAQFHLATNNLQLANLVPLQKQNVGAAGLIQLTADAAADLRQINGQSDMNISNINADLSARGLRVQNQDAGNLSATARTSSGAVQYNLSSDFAGSDIRINGRTALVRNYPTTADAFIRNLSVAKALQITGQSAIPARGDFSAEAHVSGTADAPQGALNFTLARANLYQEPIDKLQGSLRYSGTLAEVSSLQLDVPAGRVTLAGSYTHPQGNFNAGSLKLRLSSSDIDAAKIVHARQAQPGLTGSLHLAADLSAGLRERQGKRELLISNLNADLSAKALRINNRPLGQAVFTAKTNQSRLDFHLDSDIASSQIHGSGQTQLSGEYPVRAALKFSNIRYNNLAPFLSVEPESKPPFDALIEGQASVDGPILNPDNLSARLQLDHLNVRTNPRGTPTGAPPARTIDFQNSGPIVIALDHSVINVQQLRIQGAQTSITGSGSINLKNDTAPLALKLNANADLGVLQDVSRDFYSSGGVALDATVRGAFAHPQLLGRLELKNANINYASSPNGLSNANGLILLNGTTAAIQNLSGESGGGKVALSGFVGFGTRSLSYNLKAIANKVRSRYSGISITSSASLTLVGNTRRSLLAGTVTIHRIAYSSASDAGSILSSAATPPSTPNAPSPFLSGMRLAIRVITAADLQVVSTYAERLDVFSNLTVRGTAEIPGVVGQVTVTNGQLVFFGNTYTVNTGTINFYNPNDIEPVLNISLETIAQGVDVILGVTGPVNNLKLSYHSDPPLTFQQIVQLLATNTTPADPTIAANQPTPAQQSLSQMGESAILGQAVANPLASRVQRVFGLSQFKIDPSISGSNGQPSARVTLQEKIASNITFTYITDVTQTNSEIVRVQLDLTSKISAVAMRNLNGNVSVEIFYKFKVQ